MLLLKQERALLQGTYVAPYKQPMSMFAIRYYLRQHTEWLQSWGTHHVEGAGSKRMSVKHSTHRFRLENRHRCACGCPEIPWHIFSWKELSLRSGFIFMLDFRIPTGDSVFFPFWFLMSFDPLPPTTLVSVSKSAGPLTLHIRAQ